MNTINTNKPLLTVFTPLYNRINTLTRTYESLCKQTSKNFMWLIIDDGSTDNTATILKKYQPIFSSAKMKMQYIYQKNAGLGSAINTGLVVCNKQNFELIIQLLFMISVALLAILCNYRFLSITTFLLGVSVSYSIVYLINLISICYFSKNK